MGCDIHSWAERKVNGTWVVVDGFHPFDERHYGVFAFLADVRNYSGILPLATPRGLPDDIEHDPEWDELGWHSFSWLSVNELTHFDYDQETEDRRVSGEIIPGVTHHGLTARPGGGVKTTYRKLLGPHFFEDLEKLKAANADRIVFAFDS